MARVLFDEAPLARWRSLAAWRAEAPAIVDEIVRRWDLTLGAPLTGGIVAHVAEVRMPDGAEAVLKVGFPHPEAIGEALALDAWGTALAPAVLDQDAMAWALLLERVRPGLPLAAAGLDPADSVAIAAGLLRRAHRVAPPAGVPALAAVVSSWPANARSTAATRSVAERRAVAAWLDLAERLIGTDGGGAFLHGDANPGNVLSSGSSWRLIDAKPMRGDAEFDLGPLVEQVGPFDAPELARRVRVAASILGADPARAIAWAGARAALNVAWAWEDGDEAQAEASMLALATWAEL